MYIFNLCTSYFAVDSIISLRKGLKSGGILYSVFPKCLYKSSYRLKETAQWGSMVQTPVCVLPGVYCIIPRLRLS